MTRRRIFWLLVALLTVFALVVEIGGPQLLFEVSLKDPISHPDLGVIMYLVLAITILAILLLLIGKDGWWDVDDSPPTQPKGELEKVLTLKNQGSLLQRSAQMRERASRTSRTTKESQPLATATPAPSAVPEGCLDYLLRLKRAGAGAWGPREAL
jgi:hypothetical protein